MAIVSWPWLCDATSRYVFVCRFVGAAEAGRRGGGRRVVDGGRPQRAGGDGRRAAAAPDRRHGLRQAARAAHWQAVAQGFSARVRRLQRRLLGRLHALVQRPRRPAGAQLTTTAPHAPHCLASSPLTSRPSCWLMYRCIGRCRRPNHELKTGGRYASAATNLNAKTYPYP